MNHLFNGLWSCQKLLVFFPEESEHVKIDVDEIPSYAVLFNEDFKC